MYVSGKSLATLGGMDNLPTEITADNLLPQLSTLEAVRELEDVLLTMPQVDLHTSHLIHAGMYARMIFIPAGTVLTGALTNADNVCVVYGDITVTTDDGPQRFTGFHVIPAKAGSKRAGVAHADTWWVTIHRTDQTELADIEDAMTGESDRLQTRKLLEVAQ